VGSSLQAVYLSVGILIAITPEPTLGSLDCPLSAGPEWYFDKWKKIYMSHPLGDSHSGNAYAYQCGPYGASGLWRVKRVKVNTFCTKCSVNGVEPSKWNHFYAT